MTRCEHPGCIKSGERTPTGYRRLCSKHRRWRRLGPPKAMGRPRIHPSGTVPTVCPTCLQSRLVRWACVGNPCRSCAAISTAKKRPSRPCMVLPSSEISAYLNGESAASIGKRIGRDCATVQRGLNAAGVPLRSMSEAISLIDHTHLLVAADAMRATGEMSRRMSAGFQRISIDEWNGFRKDHWERMRSSSEWKLWREQVFVRDGYKCRFCGGQGPLDPHHIRPKAMYPGLVFDPSNGLTLCRPCHATTFGREDSFVDRCDALVAEGAGRAVVAVDPRGTSQACSGCGVVVKKCLAVRVHRCPDCGLVLDRDVNAAKNVLTAGRAVQGAAVPARTRRRSAKSKSPRGSEHTGIVVARDN